jgi:hypothetical protein
LLKAVSADHLLLMEWDIFYYFSAVLYSFFVIHSLPTSSFPKISSLFFLKS